MNDELSVVLVEDDAMVRGWVRLTLEGTEFRLGGEASSAAEALELVPRRVPSVLLVDYRLPDGTGTELVRELRHRGISAPAVLFSANAERGFNEFARESGAQGTVLKTGRGDELLSALRVVAAGETSYDVRHPKRPAGRGPLSPRERDVLRLVAAGKTNKEIAAELDVGDETVKTLVSRTFLKLGVKRRAEAVEVGHDLGIL